MASSFFSIALTFFSLLSLSFDSDPEVAPVGADASDASGAFAAGGFAWRSPPPPPLLPPLPLGPFERKFADDFDNGPLVVASNVAPFQRVTRK